MWRRDPGQSGSLLEAAGGGEADGPDHFVLGELLQGAGGLGRGAEGSCFSKGGLHFDFITLTRTFSVLLQTESNSILCEI